MNNTSTDTSSLQNPGHLYSGETPGTYLVELIVTNAGGCKDTAYGEIIITPDWNVFIPNTFTPNGDGKNDAFIPVATGIDEFEMWVYDRWGNIIYNTSNLYKAWDGKVQEGASDKLAQQDTYVYVVIVKDNTKKQHKYVGHVNLIR